MPIIVLTAEQIALGMNAALEQAQAAALRNEVPVGATVLSYNQGVSDAGGFLDTELIAQSGNRVEELNDATAHAEVLVIRAAALRKNNWRLDDCALFVTLEPCTMCIGAIRNARIGALVFGASDARAGAAGSLYDISLDPRLGAVPRVISGVNAQECAQLLKDFFARVRSGAK